MKYKAMLIQGLTLFFIMFLIISSYWFGRIYMRYNYNNPYTMEEIYYTSPRLINLYNSIEDTIVYSDGYAYRDVMQVLVLKDTIINKKYIIPIIKK